MKKNYGKYLPPGQVRSTSHPTMHSEGFTKQCVPLPDLVINTGIALQYKIRKISNMNANDAIKNSLLEKHIPELHFSLFKMFSNCWLSNASRYLDRDIHTISHYPVKYR